MFWKDPYLSGTYIYILQPRILDKIYLFVKLLEKYLSIPKSFEQNPTDEFLKLAGSWDDDRTADEIINDIRKNRVNSKRFGKKNELFD